jgi:hypothetical protein
MTFKIQKISLIKPSAHCELGFSLSANRHLFHTFTQSTDIMTPQSLKLMTRMDKGSISSRCRKTFILSWLYLLWGSLNALSYGCCCCDHNMRPTTQLHLMSLVGDLPPYLTYTILLCFYLVYIATSLLI